jgi:hypothetical protein
MILAYVAYLRCSAPIFMQSHINVLYKTNTMRPFYLISDVGILEHWYTGLHNVIIIHIHISKREISQTVID